MKKFFSYIIAVVAIWISAAGAVEAQTTTLPTTEVNGVSYYYYDVQPKETIYSISKRLGIDRQTIIDANPAVADGLQAYTRLYFPTENGVMTAAPAALSATETMTHTVEKGETLYGIARKYGVTVDRLIELNPSARDGVKRGETLVVARPDDEGNQPVVTVKPGGEKYVIQQGETLYRIASDRGLTVEQLLAANPGLDPFNYAVGTEILLPGGGNLYASNATEEAPRATLPTTAVIPTTPVKSQPSTQPVRVNQPLPTSVNDEDDEEDAPKANIPEKNMPHPPVVITIEEPLPEGRQSFDVAVILPFMLKESNPSRVTKMYTDFYRGILMAAENNNESGQEIRLHAYDSAGSNDTVKALLNRPEMKKMALIIGPDTEEQLTMVINAVDEDSTFVFNPFVVRNNAYTNHPNVIQGNIPQEMMLAKAAEAYMNNLAGHTPVFISRIKGQAEKDQFVQLLKERMNDRGIKYEEITFNDVLEDTDLRRLDPATPYAFVPVSGQRAEFLRFVEALKDFAKTNSGGVMLLGYPDYVVFRGKQLEDLSELNTLIYTRFYFDSAYYPSRRFAQDFRANYGEEMIEAAPIMAVSGYDAGNYLFKALRENGGDFHLKPVNYNGLQMHYIMSDDSTEGLVNTSLQLIKFKPNAPAAHSEIK